MAWTLLVPICIICLMLGLPDFSLTAFLKFIKALSISLHRTSVCIVPSVWNTPPHQNLPTPKCYLGLNDSSSEKRFLTIRSKLWMYLVLFLVIFFHHNTFNIYYILWELFIGYWILFIENLSFPLDCKLHEGRIMFIY